MRVAAGDAYAAARSARGRRAADAALRIDIIVAIFFFAADTPLLCRPMLPRLCRYSPYSILIRHDA